MVKFLDLQKINKESSADLIDQFTDVLSSGWYIMGAKLKEFENDFACYSGVKYCIGVANGLEAIELSLKALGVGEGDEVIVPSNTYIATLIAVSNVGATPVMVEPDIESYNIDPSKIEVKITSKTKAIIPVHLYGQCCEMPKIIELSKKYDVKIVEDNAQSQGAKYEDQLTGSFGDVNATSFYPGKNLGALGDGGAITTNNKDVHEFLMMLRNYGSQKKYVNEIIGKNSRLDEMQAAFLSVKLKRLDRDNKLRSDIAEIYNSELDKINNIITPKIKKKCTSVYHQFIIRIEERDELQKYLLENKIQTLIHYPIPPHLQKAYEYLGFKRGSFPISEEIADTCLSLPIYPGMPMSDVEKVISTIKQFYG